MGSVDLALIVRKFQLFSTVNFHDDQNLDDFLVVVALGQ